MFRKDNAIAIRRDELYKKVWKTPMYKLASEYGLSDVGLKKICKKLKVPTPPQGYWVRLKYGYKIKQTPLPKLKAGEPNTYTLSVYAGISQSRGSGTPVKKYGEEAFALMENLQEKMPIRVQSALTDPHPLVSTTHKGFERAKPNTSTGLLHPKGRNCLNITVAPENTDRALIAADAFMKFLESNGIRVRTEKPGEVRANYIELFGEKIEFGIKESTNKYEVEPPKKSFWQHKTFRYEPNGKLSLYIGGSGGNLRRTWADGSLNKLEGLLNGFVLGLVKAADYKRRQRIEREERDRRWEEERRREEQIRNEISLEQQRQKTLEELTKLWIHSDQVRQFIAAAEAKAGKLKLSRTDSRRFELWKIWANRYADSLDPLSRGLPHQLKIVKQTRPRQLYGYQW
jgi:hypothetical protein